MSVAVSYTHLDVYKRQTLISERFELFIFIFHLPVSPSARVRNTNIKMQIWLSGHPTNVRYTYPVSYTHLNNSLSEVSK